MKKNIVKLAFALASLLMSISCSDKYIDDINEVAQGSDIVAPTVEIISPAGNLLIPSSASGANVKFQYKVIDDIEIGNVDLYLDGVKIESKNSFLDYRIYNGSYSYNNLSTGSHTIKVDAKDMTGKMSTKSFTFTIDKYTKKSQYETLYMPFSGGNVFTDVITTNNPTVTGNPITVSNGYSGAAYGGGNNSYLSFPLSGLYSENGISFTFWYKVNSSPDRAGIITINDDDDNSNENRKKGFRLFREGNTLSQTIKLNLGIGSDESWNDGGVIAVNNQWVHIAVTISKTESKVYFDGVLVRTTSYVSPFDFSSSNNIVIGSGAPSFSYWGHNSDLSLIDEVRVYNKALDQAEVMASKLF
ncbi:Concanavalin A-like lectin/glucanases superfamily protein [Chryseobacterium taichungense]|uniref:Concanavalin A-like lectin/glucanases superfamily protein n=1 Tax=Chryseobacterium taichungense TaxID=295069 RepID=A0A1H8CIG3_9FLAO|nr:LamG-like jellyroll fold domain-containing protein [Chryseobacterium taichungense]SEM94742.1 Concanavalin A-like lectin/glucanases superfamily protein [Chryseobacterium taichungense]